MALDIALGIITVVLAIVAGHILITKILPKLREVLGCAIKDINSINALMVILMFYVGVFVVNAIVNYLVGFENQYTQIAIILEPALNILIKLAPYIGLLILAAIIAIAIKKK